MNSIPTSKITVGTRHRQDMGDLQTLADSIRQEGLLQPVGVTADGLLVFGERRLRAVRDILGWAEVPARVVNVTSIAAGEYAENEVRKDFTASERVAIGRTLEAQIGDRQGQRTDIQQDDNELRRNCGEVAPGCRTEDVVAQQAGFGSGDSYRRAKVVVDHGVPELVAEMDAGRVAVSTAATVATLPQAEQAEVVARGETEILRKAKEIRAQRTEERRQDRIERIAKISRGNAPLTGKLGRFPVIYADPPWRYEHAESESRAIENQYPTMDLDAIGAMPVADLTAEDAILFLWATSPKLEEALEVLHSWGFTYRTCAVWDKGKIGMGYYFRQQHELLLVGTKGRLPPPAPPDRPSSVLREDRGEHSAKPERVCELIERMYPMLPKIELFGRSPRQGWVSWGNQAKAA